MQRLIKSSWLLALCGFLDAIISAFYLIRLNTEAHLGFYAWHSLVGLLGKLTLAAGICTSAAAVWNTRKCRSWMLMLNGIACSALGAILAFWTGPLAFRAVALLITAMATSIGVFELTTLRDPGRRAGEWFIGAAGAGSFGFAALFLAFVFRWIRLDPGSAAQSSHWLGSYFAFSASCMLLLALSLPMRSRTVPPPH